MNPSTRRCFFYDILNSIKRWGPPEMFGDASLSTVNSSHLMFWLIRTASDLPFCCINMYMMLRSAKIWCVAVYTSVGLSSQVWVGRLQLDRCGVDVRVYVEHRHRRSPQHIWFPSHFCPQGHRAILELVRVVFLCSLQCCWPWCSPYGQLRSKKTEIFSHQCSQTA